MTKKKKKKKPAARALSDAGVEVVQGNLTGRASLDRALVRVYGPLIKRLGNAQRVILPVLNAIIRHDLPGKYGRSAR
jgi:uncharacterized protein YbjT (DUF2867 family)